MKAVVILFALVLGIWAKTLPESEKTFLKRIHDTCQADSATHADEDLLRHMEDNSHNTKVMAHMLCMAQGADMISHSGTLNKDVIKNKMSMVMDDDQLITTMMHKCAVKKDTSMATAMHMWMCFMENHIEYMHIL